MKFKPLSRLLSKMSEAAFRVLVLYALLISPVYAVQEPATVSQGISVTGHVTSSEDGMTLPGVNVVIKGSSRGTATDIDGNYAIAVPSPESILVFSLVGYETAEVTVGDKTLINVVLKPSISALDEIVVVGYGTQKAENLTGSVATVDLETLGKRPVTDVASLLQGVAPGLNIRPSNDLGGEPGAAMNIDIRGIGSLSGGGPFILVDGVPMDINRISPNDIETVTVLKDAAASAIYGARAPYGVILITTKSGKKNQKTALTYSNNIAFRSPTTLPRLANSLGFARALNYGAQNSGAEAIFSEEMIQHIIAYQQDPDNYPGLQVIPGTNAWAGTGGSGSNYKNANTDWYDVIYKDWAFQQNHNISLSGGAEKTAYYLGMDIAEQQGSMNFANDRYLRYGLTSNLSVDPVSWMTVTLRTKFIHADNRYPMGQSSEPSKEQFNIDLARAWPVTPLYTPNGDLSWNFVNVLANGGKDRRYENSLIITPEIDVRITDDWDITANFSYQSIDQKSLFVTNKIFDHLTDGTPVPNYLRTFDMVERGMSRDEYYSSNVFTTFTQQLNRHNIKLMVGGQAEKSKYEGLSGWKRDLISPSVESIKSATGDFSLTDDLSHWATLGVFGRFNYNYEEKYLLEINGRYDGSSRFGTGRRWGFFPSASIGYNISKEDFWEPLAYTVNNLKFRASYGNLGNQNVANYLHYILIPVSTNLGYIMDGQRPVYASAPGLGSLGLTWETSSTINFGLDAGLFQNKLNLTLDLYNRKTKNMFGPGESLPNLLGTRVPQQNNATLETKGIELTMGWKQAINELNLDLTLIYSDNKSTVLEYNNPTRILNTYYEGMTLGEIWGFESDGLFQSAQEVTEGPDQSELYGNWQEGDVRYKDRDGDGRVSYGDNTRDNPGDQMVIGNSNPRHMWGFRAFANYKGFDLGLFLQGVAKRDDILDDNVFFGFSPNGIQHTSLRDYTLDYWTPENGGAYYARPYITDENTKNQYPQTRWLQDASYIRLKNVQLGYTAPGALLDKIKIQKIRLFLSGENLLTFTKLPKGVDPENSYGTEKDYPLSRVLSFGIDITL